MLPVSEFHVYNASLSGLQARCKGCCVEYQRKHKIEKLDRRMGPCDEPEPEEPEEPAV